jgi:hypothetical protein
MKIRSGSDVRIMTQVVTHYRHSVRQGANDTGTMPAFGVSRADGEPRTLHAFAPNAATGRKVKVLKSGVRRVTYR